MLGETDYEALLARGGRRLRLGPPADEWDAIALNYTSGTTGNPKGVVYHHRGAYLNAVAIVAWAMPASGLPVDAAACSTATAGAFRGRWPPTRAPTCACGTSRPEAIFDAIREQRVTHFCGAPVVH